MFLAAPIRGASLPSGITLKPEEIFARATRAGKPSARLKRGLAGIGALLPVPGCHEQGGGNWRRTGSGRASYTQGPVELFRKKTLNCLLSKQAAWLDPLQTATGAGLT